MDISNQEYIEIASGYLIENFGGEYTFVSLKKASDNEVYVLMKSENLDNQEVNVQILISDQKIDSYTCHVASNYLSILFENTEKEYYKDFFKKYFTDCDVVIDNKARFLDYYSVYWDSDEITGEWVEHKNEEITFELYRRIIRSSKSTFTADIVVTDKDTNVYLSSEDRLKCSLVDLQSEDVKLDCTVYVANSLDANYLDDWILKAKVAIYEDSLERIRYGYQIEKTE